MFFVTGTAKCGQCTLCYAGAHIRYLSENIVAIETFKNVERKRYRGGFMMRGVKMYIRIARDLGYDEGVIAALRESKSDGEASSIMSRARLSMIEDHRSGNDF